MPANFFQDTKTTDNITYWEQGSYTMPQGTSKLFVEVKDPTTGIPPLII